ncbi:MAG: ring-cleaving dioxygenase [Spirochaetaceae bacterium]
MTHVSGIHHITAIAGDPQENLNFYVGVLGLRLVKKSINQDAPDTYHLFFADGDGHPGTDLTFFPWPNMGAGRSGTGVWGEVSFAVPAGSLDYWESRLREHGVRLGERETRFGEQTLPFSDPHGMSLTLTETRTYPEQPFTPWSASAVPAGHQIRALSSVRITVRESEATAAFLAAAYGFAPAERDGEWTRYTVGEGAGGQRIDIRADASAPRGRWGTGSVHHVAFRVPDDTAEAQVRSRILEAGGAPTPVIDRFWFKSVYTQAPAGVLCEIATDGPGFSVDEDPDHLGEALVLPPWYESRRRAIESMLPPLEIPEAPVGVRPDPAESPCPSSD